ncbi:MAG: peptidyl-prolyl cis-trans isomerase [Gammaproteobacteria bacterium]|nr:peptidyl-prolyl cis-trans isomerase [Gammaproteobacteria bacterium]
MLEKIREGLKGWMAWAFIAVIGVPLALTFVGGDGTFSGGGTAATVNGEDIPLVDFQRVLQDRMVARQQETRSALSPEVEEQLKRETLDGLVLNRAVIQFVRDAGFRVSAQRVVDHIRTLPNFQVGGQFSKPAYDAALAANAVPAALFESEQRSLLEVNQLQDGIAGSSFFTPAEFRRIIALDQQRRDLDYVLLDPKVLGAAITPTEAEIQAWYATNAAEFQTAETVDLDYLEISLADTARDYVPDEAELRKAYDEDPTRFRSAEERQARHILISAGSGRTDAEASALADEIAKKLADGADFAALATQYSSDPGSAARGGDLGFAGRGVYVEAFEQALFALQPGQTSAPVKTEFGYHIIRLEAIKASDGQSFEQVREQLAESLREQKAQDTFYALAERLDDLALESPGSLEPAARELGLQIRRYPGYTRAGGGPFGDNADLGSAVFSEAVLEGGENTPLIELDSGRVVVARVAEHKLPEARPLAEVRDQIVERLRTRGAASEARKLGEEILNRQQAGEDLASVAASMGLNLLKTGPVFRRSPVLPPDLLAAVFRAPAPSGDKPVVRGVALADGGYAVFRLNGVIPGQPDQIPQEQRDAQQRILGQRTAQAELAAFAAELRGTAKVVVAKDLFKAEELAN